MNNDSTVTRRWPLCAFATLIVALALQPALGIAQDGSSSGDASLDSLLGPVPQQQQAAPAASATPKTNPAPSKPVAAAGQAIGTNPAAKPGAPSVAPVPAVQADSAAPADTAAKRTPAVKVETASSGNPKTKNRLLEEIIVTAERREENIQNVPISIQSFNGDYLAAKGVIAQQDLPQITPGLVIGKPVGFSTIYLRGVGSDAFMLGDPLVVTYIDGVYFPSSTSQFQDFGNVKSVEVDKGPQGTLFGRNALGGAIQITTKDPGFDAVHGAVSSTYLADTGSDASRYTLNNSGYISVPLTDKLAVSMSGLYDRDDPYFDQKEGPVGDHHLVPAGHSYAYRFKIFWKPTDDVDVRANVYRFSENEPDRQFAVNTQPSILSGSVGGVPLLVPKQDPFKGGDIDSTVVSIDNGLTYFGTVDWRTHYVNFKLLGNYEKITAQRNFDFDASSVPVAFFEAADVGRFIANTRSLELRLLSNDSAPDWLKVVGGVYYFSQTSGVDQAHFRAGGINLSAGTIAGLNLPGLSDLLAGVYNKANLPIANGGVELGLEGNLNDKSIAGYGQATVSFTDWVSLTLGARYQADKRYVLFSNQSLILNSTSIPLFSYGGAPGNPQFHTSTDNFDPKVSLNFRPQAGWLGDSPLLYVSYQTASTGNTFNAVSLISPPSLAKGTKITAYQAGFKSSYFDSLVSLDLAAFYYGEKNAQSQVVSLQSGGAVHFENIPKLRTYGGEIGLVAQILPSLTNNGLVFTAGGSYLNSKFLSYPDASGFDPTTGIYSNTNDYTGNRPVQTPEFTVTAGLNQTFQIPDGPLELGVQYYFNSGYFYLAQNTPNTKVGAYHTVGFTVSYLYQPWNVRITGFGRNVLNERYMAARFINDFGTDDFPANLSSYGVTLHYDF